MSKLIDVVIIRSNSMVKSPRVTKIARSLRKKYYVRAIGWNREGLPPGDFLDFVVDLDILNLRAPVGRPALALYMPLFWIYSFGKLLKHRPKVVHACDLDTMLPAYLYKLLLRRKIIFDVCDRYAMSKIPVHRRTLYSLVLKLEEFYATKADCLVNVSHKLEGTFRKRPKRSIVIMNCADPEYDDGDYNTGIKNSTIRDKENGRDEIKSDPTCPRTLTLVYTGNIVRRRGIEKITQAMRGLQNVRLLIAGKIIDNQLFEDISTMDNVKYFGHLSLPAALELERTSDVMVVLYDPSNKNNEYAMPNKLFESMMFSIPLITNICKEIIERTKSGLVVEYDDIEQIKRAVIMLRDNYELRSALGRNGRVAFENEYNWKQMQETLYSTYAGVLDMRRK